jgi:photosystem II stability/assembly factor-like uncharacterized protein
VTEIDHSFDDVARSLTRRLIAAAEQAPSRVFEPRPAGARTAAVLLATVAVVAGIIGFGTGVLHLQPSLAPTPRPRPPLVSPSVSASPVPTPEPSPTSSPVEGIANLRMFSTEVGWAQRQSDGAILHTTHGVQRWTVASSSFGGQEIIATAFVDGDAARVMTALASAIQLTTTATIQSWATNDGGVTWTRGGTLTGYAIGGEPPGTLDFVDRDHGWFSVTGLAAAGSSEIFVYRTIDEGLHWQEVDRTNVSPVPGPGQLSAGCDKVPVTFLNASVGWDTAACNGGPPFFYVTRNGGVTWEPQSIGLPWQPWGYTTSAPQFVNGDTGFMVGSGGPPGTHASLFVTTNGGATWVRRPTPITYPDATYFFNADKGWVQDGSTLYVTDDGGRTWAALHAPSLGALDFLTATLGWSFLPAPGPWTGPASLMQTTDGGRTWTAVIPIISG